MTDTLPRFPELNEAALSARQREVYDAIVSGPRGDVVGPLRVWLQSPELAARAQALGQYVRFDSALTPAQSELAILVTARIWSSDFEWSHHAPIAAKAGVSADVIEAIANARRPNLDNDVSRAVFDVAVEIHRDRAVSDDTFARARSVLGESALVDLIGICGYYAFISMTINAFHVPPDGPTLPKLGLPAGDMFRDPPAA